MIKQLNNIKWVNKRMYHCVLVVVMCRAERRAELIVELCTEGHGLSYSTVTGTVGRCVAGCWHAGQVSRIGCVGHEWA